MSLEEQIQRKFFLRPARETQLAVTNKEASVIPIRASWREFTNPAQNVKRGQRKESKCARRRTFAVHFSTYRAVA